MTELGLPSGRGSTVGGECLIVDCPEAATGTTIAFNVPSFGDVRGYVCARHCRQIEIGTMDGLSLAVELKRPGPARPA